ncbi:hypothetical protein AB0H57_28735 [Micromonospora sp. NPDC050686]|uniref:hypothetical protein n=1 Tax=Micromonospora sp. NPDC050686 TaxID=3154631 RepID=UPI0033C6593A
MYQRPARVFARIGEARPAAAPRVLLGRAVVLGASMAGLLAARVLADHAQSVLILDRDEIGAGAEPRPGVPQGTQMHADPGAGCRVPGGVVAVGDAVASFNPIYGQGMSSAALHASCLSAYLRSGADPRGPARGFFALQRVIVDAAWGMSTSADLARPSVSAPRPRGYRLSRWASNQIVGASIVDPVIARRFDAVVEMRRHPSTLASPAVLARAVRMNRSHR